ncbi:MAG TPA: DUF167 domain-containing protein [Candidatus Kaiserbacteria bacterium]|nr:DUF167 domain-containing protein [Candidatus Kaiserbacteria bacterium]
MHDINIKIVITASARKEKVEKTSELSWRISVKEPALRNRANTRMREIIALQYSVPITHIFLMTGHHSRSKMIRVITS